MNRVEVQGLQPVSSLQHSDLRTARLSQVGLVAWLLSLTMIPIWIGVDFVATIPVQCIVGVVAILVVAISGAPFSLTKFDVYFLVFLAVSLAAMLLENSIWAEWAKLLIRWGISLLAARVLVPVAGIRFVTNAIAIVFGLVGGMALLELLLVWHPFTGWSGTVEYAQWSGIQTRGGRDRSEWAFGHSIALGGSLAMSIPFIFSSSYKTMLKLVLLVLVAGGILASASRGAVLAAGLTGALFVLHLMKTYAARTLAIALTSLFALSSVSIAAALLEGWALSTDEMQSSLNYRFSMYETYLQEVQLFGPSPAIGLTGSTDSAVLVIGLKFGWIVALIALVPILISAIRILIGSASIAEIALVGQLPLLGSVALITQYELIFFFIAGIAAQSAIADRQMRINRTPPNSSNPPGLRPIHQTDGIWDSAKVRRATAEG